MKRTRQEEGRMREIRKAQPEMYAAELDADLGRYREAALEQGASRAAVIPVGDIPVDERVTLKCRVPRCFGYGVGANCPPHTLTPAELRGLLEGYRWAVFFGVDVPPPVIVRDRATIEERVDAYQKVYDMVSNLESLAFYDGHYLAFGLAAGSCRHTFCGSLDDCAALEGKKCRFSLKSRPSLEAVGVDVFRLAAGLGWDIYPIGSCATPDEVPHGTLCGMVVVQ